MIPLQFFSLSLGEMSKENQETILASDHVKPYYHFLERVFAASQHQLGQEAEKVMTMMYKPACGDWASMTEDALKKITKETLLPEGERGTKTFE